MSTKRLPSPPVAEIVRICNHLAYDPMTGALTWRKAPQGSRRKDGDLAGYVDRNGYRTIRFGRRLYLASRLAWYLHYGAWADFVIDHRDMNPSNDSIGNLRRATNSQNIAHAPRRKNNTSGYKGVCFVRRKVRRDRWVAYINPGRHIFLGYFDTKDDAAKAHDLAAAKYFGEFSVLNFHASSIGGCHL